MMLMFRIMYTAVVATFTPVVLSGQAVVQIVSEASCAECQVELRPVVTLGDADGPGMLENNSNQVRTDSRGRYFVSSGRPYFWVFDREGRVVRRIGRDGDGPGEFRSISGILIDLADSLFVIDNRQGRISVFSPEDDLVRTVNLGFSAGFRGQFVGTNMILNAMIKTPDRVGYPLHLVNTRGEIGRSFGSETSTYRPDLREALELREVAAGEGAVWAAWINQYVIERWDMKGQLSRALRRDVDWFPTWWKAESDPTTPPLPVTTAIQEQGDTLWVLVRVPDANWKAAVKTRGGRTIIEDYNSYQDTMVEALDVRTGELLASTRFPRVLYGFAGPGLVFGPDSDAVGNPVVPIWALRITNLQRNEE